jgi:uncharacterized protein (DUF488 family)
MGELFGADERTALVTIGYEGREPETYVRALVRAGATILCDVRRNPVSRRPGFSKKALTAACAAAGIRYEHLPQLGIASERRRAIESPEDVERLFAEYERVDLPREHAAVETIREWMRAGECVALTCLERDPAECHRGRLAAALERASGGTLVARHL